MSNVRVQMSKLETHLFQGPVEAVEIHVRALVQCHQCGHQPQTRLLTHPTGPWGTQRPHDTLARHSSNITCHHYPQMRTRDRPQSAFDVTETRQSSLPLHTTVPASSAGFKNVRRTLVHFFPTSAPSRGVGISSSVISKKYRGPRGLRLVLMTLELIPTPLENTKALNKCTKVLRTFLNRMELVQINSCNISTTTWWGTSSVSKEIGSMILIGSIQMAVAPGGMGISRSHYEMICSSRFPLQFI